SIQLYLSRPLSRTEYLLGKISVLAVVLLWPPGVPLLVPFVFLGHLAGPGLLFVEPWDIGGYVVGRLVWVALFFLLALALSVWVRWRIAATGLMFAIFFVLPGFGFALNAVLRTRWGWLLNLSQTIFIVWGNLFRVPMRYLHPRAFGQPLPLWLDW